MKKILIVVVLMIFSIELSVICVQAEDEKPPEFSAEVESVEDANNITSDKLVAILQEIGWIENEENLERIVDYLKLSGMTEEDARVLLIQTKEMLEKQYGTAPWYQKASQWFDDYIGYLVAFVLFIGITVVALIIKKTGIDWFKDKLKWVEGSFLPWVKDKSKNLEEMQEQYQLLLEAGHQLHQDYEHILSEYQQAESDKQLLEQKLISAEQNRTQEVVTSGKKYAALTQALSLMATELSFVADTFGLNNRQAELVKQKYAAIMELISDEIRDTDKVVEQNVKQG